MSKATERFRKSLLPTSSSPILQYQIFSFYAQALNSLDEHEQALPLIHEKKKYHCLEYKQYLKISLAEVYLSRGELEKAQDLIKSSRDYLVVNIYAKIVTEYTIKNNKEKIAECFEYYKSDKNGNEALLTGMIKGYLKKGDLVNSKTTLEKISSLVYQIKAYFAFAKYYEEKNNKKSAILNLEKALEKINSSGRIEKFFRNDLALMFLNFNEAEHASEIYQYLQKAKRIESKLEMAFCETYIELGELDMIIVHVNDYLDEHFDCSSPDERVYFNLHSIFNESIIKFGLDKTSEMVSKIENPEVKMLFLLKLSELYLKTGNQNKANELINNALKITLECFEYKIRSNALGTLMYLNILQERNKLELNENNQEELIKIYKSFIKHEIN